MNFIRALPTITEHFDQARLRYALIGGLAMALHGVQRATLDADFILLSDDLGQADAILTGMGYRLEFQSENVSHYLSNDPDAGRIDLLHAFRPATLGMLQRAGRIKLSEDCRIPVVHLEDLIGLKVQAACNDPERAEADWSDIRRLVRHAGTTGRDLDWSLIEDYLNLFDQGGQLPELRQLHGLS